MAVDPTPAPSGPDPEIAKWQAKTETLENSLASLQAKLTELESRKPADDPRVTKLESQLAETQVALQAARDQMARLVKRLPRKKSGEVVPPARPPGPTPPANGRGKTARGLDWI